ncbi:MAG: flagellar hook-length control protein FliK [Planctomycetes bacterium]|nr:flagellar hook-length control protein FliK [Planctomycetota bacterium]
MLNTFHGTVESDPMRIPAPARMTRGDEGAFATALEEATAPREPEPQPVVEAPADIDDEIAAVSAEVGDEGGEEAVASEAESAEPTAMHAGASPLMNGTEAASGDQDETQSRGEPGWQKTAGKGTVSPRTSSKPGNGEPLRAELAELTERAAQQRIVAPIAVEATATPAAAGKTGGEALLRGVEAAGPRSDRGTAIAAKPGYRTNPTATAAMLEQSRESIFKQLMLKITAGGGEMRMRLDPPDLGELDLRMVVENGNRLTLAIAAERGDMADLIQRHLAELSETLASVGLELASADIHARGGGARNDLTDDERAADGGGDSEQPAVRPTRSGGYIHANGLDFWV